MNNENKIKLGIVGALIILVGVLTYSRTNKFGVSNIPYGASSFTNSATTTAVGQPTLIADGNVARRIIRVQNASDTAVFLYFQYFASPSAASTTVVINKGFALTASGTPGSFYEFNQNNYYPGQIWATSTASGKLILTAEGI